MRARVRVIGDLEEAKREIAKLGAEELSVDIMAPKALHFNLIVENVRSPVAIIIKESMLSEGGDAAIHREAITGGCERCDLLVMATHKQLRKAVAKMKMQPWGIPDLGTEMLRAMDNFRKVPEPWKLPDGRAISFDRTRLMGVINLTSDSFSGDGLGGDLDRAVELAVRMEADGADIIDIGGESTRPGATGVSEEEEMRRVLPLLERLSGRIAIPLSIDTRKPNVARAAIEAGASMLNDVTALSDPGMLALCAEKGVPAIAMHMKGSPETMQQDPYYDDVIGEIMRYLSDAVDRAAAAGIEPAQVAVDPGIGFGKRFEDNVEILRRLSEFRSLGQPIALGASRKSFIGRITGLPESQRLEGSVAAACIAALNGASVVRAHDVKETKLALRIVEAVKSNRALRESGADG